jgi:hypothetical protein
MLASRVSTTPKQLEFFLLFSSQTREEQGCPLQKQLPKYNVRSQPTESCTTNATNAPPDGRDKPAIPISM